MNTLNCTQLTKIEVILGDKYKTEKGNKTNNGKKDLVSSFFLDFWERARESVSRRYSTPIRLYDRKKSAHEIQ